MLLEHLLLTSSEARAARVWAIRERTEHEAAALFRALARDLEASGAPEALVVMARQCADDELVHAKHCRAIVDALDPGVAPLAPGVAIALGPRDARPARRALYASVALGCVTESLSTALLLEIRPRTELEVARRGLSAILEDEVRHSRLGWACLAHAHAREDVRWIAEHVPAMLHAALDVERATEPGGESLARYGILDAEDVERVCRSAVGGVIVPGLARFGIDVAL